MPDWLLVLVAVVLGGGGIVALQRFRPEAAAVTVQAAEQVVIMQKGHIDSLTDRIQRLESRVVLLDEELDAIRRERDRTEERLSIEIRELRGKVQILVQFIIDQGLEPPVDLDTEPHR